MTRARAAAFLAAAFCCVLARPATSEAPLFSVYPSYGAKFDIGTGKFSLVTHMVIYNISGQAYTDVTFKQTYPDGVSVKETYQREIGTEATGEQSSSRKVEGNDFVASMPTFKNRMYVVIPNELVLARRLVRDDRRPCNCFGAASLRRAVSTLSLVRNGWFLVLAVLATGATSVQEPTAVAETVVVGLVFAGKLKPVIDRVFGIADTAEAYAELSAGGRHFGKLAIAH